MELSRGELGASKAFWADLLLSSVRINALLLIKNCVSAGLEIHSTLEEFLWENSYCPKHLISLYDLYLFNGGKNLPLPH